MFNLPELTDLAQRVRLSFRDLTRIGEDIRVLARLQRQASAAK